MRKLILATGITNSNVNEKQITLDKLKEEIIALKQEYTTKIELYTQEENRVASMQSTSSEEINLLKEQLKNYQDQIAEIRQRYPDMDLENINDATYLIFFKKQRQIRLESVQSVDISRPLVARILGLSELRLEAADGAEEALHIKYLSHASKIGRASCRERV